MPRRSPRRSNGRRLRWCQCVPPERRSGCSSPSSGCHDGEPNSANPRIGDIPLRSLRVEHLDGLYHSLLTTGSRDCGPLASKAVYDVHVIVRSSLADAVRRHLVDTNVALAAHAPRSTQRAQRTSGSTQHSISPHTRACAAANSPDSAGATGTAPHIASRSHAAGKSSAAAPSKSPSRPAPVDDCVDLDPGTEQVLERWRHTQHRDGHPGNLNDPVFTNSHGQPVHAESISQLFDRHLARTDIPRIRFHDLRHTHARLLVAAGTPIKVVSERLGHGHPGFTMATYQHLVPGMSATAATDFANLIATHRDDHLHLAGAH